MKFHPARLLVPLLLLSCSSCALFDPRPTNQAADKLAVVPPEFLLTRYAPLNRWLDTAVRVQIFDVPLSQVIQEPCLQGVNYRIVQPPMDDPIIFIDKLALTRRQLLWSLAQDHQLHMTPVFAEPNRPAYIEIRSRAARNDAKARGDR
ncbi:MAG: hypothetical protein JWL81_441 [Verrucomicrobiales bacterium]|nr:hypothetical protein [Verrucomicrobiales bacterium]